MRAMREMDDAMDAKQVGKHQTLSVEMWDKSPKSVARAAAASATM